MILSACSWLDIAVAGDYLLITLRDLPLADEGIHRLLVSLDGGDPSALDVAVFLVSRPPVPLDVH